jgi:trk system potassium uptake protein TrkA
VKALIIGCSRVGSMVAVNLHSKGHSVRVMDSNPRNFLRLPEELRDTSTVKVDTINEGVLRSVGIESFDVLIAVSARDTRNIFVAQLAKYIFGMKRVICHVNDPKRYEMYQELDLCVVSPTQFVVDAINQNIVP